MYRKDIVTSASLAVFAAALLAPPQAQADTALLDIEFAYEMLDPGFCMMPPGELADEELIAASRAEGVSIPIRGEMTAPVSAALFGSGQFNTDSDSAAVVATITTMIVTDDEEVMALCVGLVPVGDTDHASGEVPVIGPGTEAPEGAAYLALSRLIDRDETGETFTVADISGGEGRIVFAENGGETLHGRLSLTGTADGAADLDGRRLEATLEFELDPDLDTFLRFSPSQQGTDGGALDLSEASYEVIEELGVQVPVPAGASLSSDDFFGHEIRGPGVDVTIGDLPPGWDDVEDAIQGMKSRFEGMENVESTSHQHGWLFTFEYEVPGHDVTAYAAMARLAFAGSDILCESMTNEPSVRDTAIEICQNLRPLE